MFSEVVGFGLSKEYFDAIAINAVRAVVEQSPEVKLGESQSDIMNRYDMSFVFPSPTWKDIATIPYGLVVIGVSYISYLLTEKLFNDLGK